MPREKNRQLVKVPKQDSSITKLRPENCLKGHSASKAYGTSEIIDQANVQRVAEAVRI